MTEVEWLAAKHPDPLLHYVSAIATQRRLRLYCCACSRLVWNLIVEPEDRQLVEIIEQFADGNASPIQLGRGRKAATRRHSRYLHPEYAATRKVAIDSARLIGLGAATLLASKAFYSWEGKDLSGRMAQAAALRDIFGNPFRPVAFDPAWRSSTATSLAETIYTDRAFEHLPILADALEDAGCTSSDVLEHCRQPGEHVRGCWVVDLVLGKA